ncbi:polymer-forming cytoskeletal protein [Lacinutrix sp. 5H-3-7-4]|uniref:bactofilin family protein n=1 Tax=Lacinutrix sp. (strain 5H-3-7-4) TaxID=983544 RepID=UPI00020A3974|nr:polymer-forming cytoskeletal protein [Lacinutrix sp. 5H-3-7-4]AEH00912.1 protein of unknown function DUF583 [Lacinutrix sp. 5H-3-7-4]
MFSDNKKMKNENNNTSIQNLIAKGTKIVGSFVSEGDIRIDGVIEGDVKTPGKVVVGKTGEIKGSLESSNAYFEGKFSGNLNLSGTLTLKSTAFIEGDVVTQKLAVEPGATFNVSCVMKTTVKDLKSGSKTQKTA